VLEKMLERGGKAKIVAESCLSVQKARVRLVASVSRWRLQSRPVG
jgi:hypothetical protein